MARLSSRKFVTNLARKLIESLVSLYAVETKWLAIARVAMTYRRLSIDWLASWLNEIINWINKSRVF